MPLSTFDPATTGTLIGALNTAWLLIGDTTTWTIKHRAKMAAQITGQLLAAADAGERDHDRLVEAALKGIEQ